MSRYPQFDRSQIRLLPLAQRGHQLTAQEVLPLAPPAEPFVAPGWPELVGAIQQARAKDRPVVLMMGGHPIKLGLSRFLIDLVQRGWITHVAGNGSVLIHDFELALVGGTSEDVPRWIARGQFGLWQETSRLNDVIAQGAARGEGLGEAVGRVVLEQRFPHRELSLAAACYQAGVPLTCHVSVGSDIIHAHANCQGEALGQCSYTDFLIFAHTVRHLEGGVYLNLGTAVTGPEVFLKALSMARNVAHRQGESIRRFATAVFDLVPLPPGYGQGPPGKEHPMYYYRPWKTLLVRTVQDGGQSYYFCGDHRRTVPGLWHALVGSAVRQEPQRRSA